MGDTSRWNRSFPSLVQRESRPHRIGKEPRPRPMMWRIWILPEEIPDCGSGTVRSPSRDVPGPDWPDRGDGDRTLICPPAKHFLVGCSGSGPTHPRFPLAKRTVQAHFPRRIPSLRPFHRPFRFRPPSFPIEAPVYPFKLPFLLRVRTGSVVPMAHQTATCSSCHCAAQKRHQNTRNMVATVSAARLAPCTSRTHVRMPSRSGTERKRDA